MRFEPSCLLLPLSSMMSGHFNREQRDTAGLPPSGLCCVVLVHSPEALVEMMFLRPILFSIRKNSPHPRCISSCSCRLLLLLSFSPVAVMMMMMMMMMMIAILMVRRIDNSQGRFQQHSEHVYVVLTPLLAKLSDEPTYRITVYY
jgi:hypothetical protein